MVVEVVGARVNRPWHRIASTDQQATIMATANFMPHGVWAGGTYLRHTGEMVQIQFQIYSKFIPSPEYTLRPRPIPANAGCSVVRMQKTFSRNAATGYIL